MSLPAQVMVPAVADEPLPIMFRLPMVVRTGVRRWRSLLLPTIGTAVMLAIVITFLGVSAGSANVFTAEYENSSANVYALMQDGVVTPILAGDSRGQIEHGEQLLSQLRSQPEVVAAIGASWVALSKERGRRPNGSRVTELWPGIGISGNPLSIPGMLLLYDGRWFQSKDEIVVGRALATAKNLHVGDLVTIANRRLRVVGIGQVRGVGFGSNGSAFLDAGTARDLSGAPDVVNLIMLQSRRPEVTIERIRREPNTNALTTAEVIAQTEVVSGSKTVVYTMFSVMALGVAALFVASTLATSVRERRKELATLLAIGVPRWSILGLILAEALVISLLAFVLGSLLGTFLGDLLDRMYSAMVEVEHLVILEYSTYLQVLVIALGLGAVAGFFPARSVLSLEPADALREA